MAEGFLLDTSIVSEFAPSRRPLPPKVAAWLAAREFHFRIASVTFAEITEGIEQLRRAGGVERAHRLETWLNDIIERFDYRILSMDVPVARETGVMSEAAIAIGRHPGLADIIIAATARVHGLTVLTRNLKHFIPLGIDCLDPFMAS